MRFRNLLIYYRPFSFKESILLTMLYKDLIFLPLCHFLLISPYLCSCYLGKKLETYSSDTFGRHKYNDGRGPLVRSSLPRHAVSEALRSVFPGERKGVGKVIFPSSGEKVSSLLK